MLTHSLRFLTITIVTILYVSAIRAETDGSPEQKEAYKTLTQEWAVVEPSLKDKDHYWHKRLLTDGAVQISKVTFSAYHNQVAAFYSASERYRSKNVPTKNSFVWSIVVTEPHPVETTDQPYLLIFLDPISKKIISAWEPPTG